ncbi:MAG: SRPBCC family protein [Sneathiella sp.]|nr:SRPBCC family protein [Sneathiella sp.]
MANVTVKQIVEAPLADVWASWDDYANIHKFHPGLNGSFLLEGSEDTGMGALRQCDLADGKNFLREEVIGYTPEKQMVIDIYEMSIPLKTARATLNYEALGDNRSQVTMSIDFVPKMGIIGKMMTPMMKKQFTKTLEDLLAGNAAYVEKQLVAAA